MSLTNCLLQELSQMSCNQTSGDSTDVERGEEREDNKHGIEETLENQELPHDRHKRKKVLSDVEISPAIPYKHQVSLWIHKRKLRVYQL